MIREKGNSCAHSGYKRNRRGAALASRTMKSGAMIFYIKVGARICMTAKICLIETFLITAGDWRLN